MSSLGQMVAGLAHEINNPISFIHGNLNHAAEYTQRMVELITAYEQAFPEHPEELAVLRDELDWDYLQTDVPEVFASMRSGTERIRQLVLSLRNFSRLDEVDLKTVDLHDGLESTLLLLGHRVNDQITIIKNYGDLPPVNCHPSQINQVFMNLLTNAIDAVQGQPHPQIAIATRLI
ncbi:MAG: histidine kinase, partial [Spirulina sp. DLM2.Bin59]